MGATLQEMLERDLGLGTEKTASAAQPADGMDKLAMELGLFGDMTKEAEEHEKDEGEGKPMGKEEEEEEEKGEKKEASDLGSLYSALFGEDDVSVVKTAEETKIASAEEAVGALSYDYFAQQTDNRITKLASDLATGKIVVASATVDGDTTADPNDKVKQPNNRVGTGPINTTPQHQGDLGATNQHEDVGSEKMQTVKAASEEQMALLETMYKRGSEMALELADQMDAAQDSEKVAEEQDFGLDDESIKTAQVCGATIEQGHFNTIVKLGEDRHNDALHYLWPFINEKVAGAGAGAAIDRFGHSMATHAKAFSPGAIVAHARQAASKLTGAHKGAIKGKAESILHPLSGKERAMEAGKALGKSMPYLGATYLAGKGVQKGVQAVRGKKEEGQQ